VGNSATPERIAQVFVLLAAVFCLANAVFMIVTPLQWYGALPTVVSTGAANGHFIVDIGLTYVCCGIVLLYGAIYPSGRWMALLAGGLWLTAHGVFHVVQFASGHTTTAHFLQESAGVLGTPALVIAALAILFATQRITPAGVPKGAFLRITEQLAPGETALFRELAAAPGHAFEKFLHFMPATMHRNQAPASLFHMARVGATLAEDCGPCALTAAHGALADGVSRELVNSALQGGRDLSADEKLAFQFGQFIANHSADAFSLGDAIEKAFGRSTRVELALTAALVRGYPAVKRGLGLSKACSVTRLEV
jgi:hypothetical protein